MNESALMRPASHAYRNQKLNSLDIFAIIIILSIFLGEYLVIRGLKLDEALLVFSCLVVLLIRRTSLSLTYTSGLVTNYAFSIWALMLSIIIYNCGFDTVSLGEVVSRVIRYGAYVFLAIVAVSNISKMHISSLLRIYRYLCLAIAVYAIAQFVLYHLMGIYLPTKILPFTWNSSKITDTWQLVAYYRNSVSGLRICGVFSEPSHLASFLLPSVIFSMFGWEKQKTSVICLVILLCGIFVSTSLKGIIIAATSIGCFLCFRTYKSNRQSFAQIAQKKMKQYIWAVAIFAVIILAILFVQGKLDWLIQRVFNAFEQEDRSANIRVLRGYSVWAKLPFGMKIFGVGIGNIGNAINANGITTIHDRLASQIEYMSGISSILVTSGLSGILAFILWIGRLFSRINGCAKLLLFQYLLSLFVGGALFSTYTIYCLFLCILANVAYAENKSTVEVTE